MTDDRYFKKMKKFPFLCKSYSNCDDICMAEWCTGPLQTSGALTNFKFSKSKMADGSNSKKINIGWKSSFLRSDSSFCKQNLAR